MKEGQGTGGGRRGRGLARWDKHRVLHTSPPTPVPPTHVTPPNLCSPQLLACFVQAPAAEALDAASLDGLNKRLNTLEEAAKDKLVEQVRQ